MDHKIFRQRLRRRTYNRLFTCFDCRQMIDSSRLAWHCLGRCPIQALELCTRASYLKVLERERERGNAVHRPRSQRTEALQSGGGQTAAHSSRVLPLVPHRPRVDNFLSVHRGLQRLPRLSVRGVKQERLNRGMGMPEPAQHSARWSGRSSAHQRVVAFKLTPEYSSLVLSEM